jgi:hypothetical protein
MRAVAPENDHTYEYDVLTEDADTRVLEPAAGLTGVQAWFSATRSGVAINAALLKTLTEAVGKSGTYFAVLDGSDITTHLTAYVGRTIWEIISDGGNTKRTTPFRVLTVLDAD